jgi:hypothetical protein
VEWRLPKWNGKAGQEDNRWKADPSLKSFLFTLKNPHNIPARKFALMAEGEDRAIVCDSSWGAHFFDIGVSSSNWSRLGGSYANDTRLDEETVFTGSKWFSGWRKSKSSRLFSWIRNHCSGDLEDQRAVQSKSNVFYHHRLIDVTTLSGQQSTLIARVLVPASTLILPEECFKSLKQLHWISFEGDSRFTGIESLAFSSSSLQSIVIPCSVEILGRFGNPT